MMPDLQALLESVAETDDAGPALARACGVVRDRLQAHGAWIHDAGTPSALIAKAGTAPTSAVDAAVARALMTGRASRTQDDVAQVREAGPGRAGVREVAAAVPL